MYHFFLGDIHFPITPESFEVKVGSNNRTVNLLSGDDINILRAPMLKEISFKAVLPEEKYPFCSSYGGFVKGSKIAERIGKMKKNNETVQFIVFRSRGLQYLGHTHISVNVEDYSVEESAEQGYDRVLKIRLKEYRYYFTRIYQENGDGSLSPTGIAPKTAESGKTGIVTVKSGDTLWDIAQRYYGSGSEYMKIYNANKDKLNDPRVILPGQQLVMP
ncbi:MAG: LysM peptidoglycan-binding domain-containing protein [Firmicutes bacterium]|nr:LysM peptidoglycan-binding domain-containing protein [Bacillota bacterium]